MLLYTREDEDDKPQFREKNLSWRYKTDVSKEPGNDKGHAMVLYWIPQWSLDREGWIAGKNTSAKAKPC